ncbi:MAG: type II toxin-antitoxin system HicA family toxin [bacterium]|nr:type II toxin-antitoxin system HicA family toxin [bacterium]
MTDRLPSCNAADLVDVLKKLGFQLDRQKGSHAIYLRESDHARVVVPVHKGRDIKRGTLKGILQDLNLSNREFLDLLNK